MSNLYHSGVLTYRRVRVITKAWDDDGTRLPMASCCQTTTIFAGHHCR